MFEGVIGAIYIEREFLDENLNLMELTDSQEELRDTFNVVIERVITFRNLNIRRLEEAKMYKEFKKNGN